MNGDATQTYQFTSTQDWFSHNIPSWTTLLPLVTAPSPRVLEIGSWEGRSGVWFLTTVCANGGSLVSIDHFDLMNTAEGRERYSKINHNLSLTGRPFRVLDAFSLPALMQLLEEEISNPDPGFDWVYVDGSHRADDTMLDGELAWRLARLGAIFIFDDYNWKTEPVESPHHPKRGIDAFLAVHTGEYDRLSKPTDYQVVLRKTLDMRIGFLLKGQATTRVIDVFEYGINVALTVNSAFAPPAAVAISSAAAHTPGRLTFYVVDCGLTQDDRERLTRSLPERADVTLVFMDLPKDSIASRCGPKWAKIDMVQVLPVQRVLYLDGDVLVRASLQDLWRVNLESKSVGAAVDVGYPMGHDDRRALYFNAGVLLMDLAKIRAKLSELTRMAQSCEKSRFADQDALNTHFADDWHQLPLGWNAQGLATYAEHPSEERKRIDVAGMKDSPCIVHFTGPVHPE